MVGIQATRLYLSVTDLADYEYCSKYFFLKKIVGIRKETIYDIYGRIEHDARRSLLSSLIHLYDSVSKIEIENFWRLILLAIDGLVRHQVSVASTIYPTFQPQIEQYIEKLRYRLTCEERTRLETATCLIKQGITGKTLKLRLLPWAIELPLVDDELAIRGRVDQVFLDGENLVPVDVKTMPYPFAFRDAHTLQVATYGLLLKRLFSKPVKVCKIYYSQVGLYREVELTEDLQKKVLKVRDAILHLLESKEAPEQIDEVGKCLYCHLRDECRNRNWVAATDAHSECEWLDKLFNGSGNLDNIFKGNEG